jgi:hypothetical protein
MGVAHRTRVERKRTARTYRRLGNDVRARQAVRVKEAFATQVFDVLKHTKLSGEVQTALVIRPTWILGRGAFNHESWGEVENDQSGVVGLSSGKAKE